MLAILVLALVLLLIAVRQVGRFSISIPAAMALGALAVLVGGAISPSAAFESIRLDIIVFLFAMFVLSAGMERSGAAEELINRLSTKAKSPQAILTILVLLFALGGALIFNDAIAVAGAPLLILLSQKLRTDPKPLILIACFAITLGSMVTPIGNPQNLLVALSGGVREPFADFLLYLLIPAALSVAALILLAPIFWPSLKEMKMETTKAISVETAKTVSMIRDHKLAVHTSVGAGLFLLLLVVYAIQPNLIPVWAVALGPALVLLALSPRRIELVRATDWMTLLFFVAMFVLMQAVWNDGAIQTMMGMSASGGGALTGISSSLADPPMVCAIAVLLSQLISNVPMVMLYLPILKAHLAAPVAYLALAGASTLAGNLTIMGAASNVILIEAARKRGVEIKWMEFFKYGIVMTIIPLVLMLVWMRLLGA